ncbi:cytochrome P450 83B1 [Citrus sinensis]|uniref:Cytochrome P450 83B1 n=1 Tax=Citrus sinensis TaxID=2711 RepID=A0ACB8MFU1_CITSI|nr:cytochrome P450 83B1 [Citrus sinensis]
MALLIVMIILLCLPIFLFFVLRRHITSSYASSLPPGPKGLPFIGNLHQFDASKPHVSFWELSKKYGPLMSLRLGFVPTLIVSSAKMAKETLKAHDLQFSGRPALVATQRLTYNGLDLVFSPYAAASKQVNLSEIIMSLSCNTICRLGFGKRSDDNDEATSERSRLHALLREIQALSIAFFVTDYFPFMGWIDKLTGMMRRMENNFQESDRFYQELIDEHLDPKRTKADMQQEDLIDVLLQIRKHRGFKVDLTLDHIKAVLMDIFVAGTDTSAATMVWTMTYLMMHPRVMKKVQEEIRSLVGGNKSFVDEDDVQELHYLKAVVKEAMRLQPPVPLLVPRETTEKCIVDGYEIPAKTIVYVNAWAIGRDPEAWENPEEFNPERFIDRSIDFKGQNFEFIPFGAGRRICPGMHLGIATVDLALANLLYKFDWEMPPGMKKQDLNFDSLSGTTVHKKNFLVLLAKYHEYVN